MIFNKHLDRLMEMQFVQDFMHRHNMQGRLINEQGNESFILYRAPYVINFFDNLIENYLEIYFSDLKCDLYIEGNSALGCSLDIGMQNLEALRARDLENNAAKALFLSEGDSKIRNLISNLEAIDKLLPLLEARGGLASMRDGTFDARFDFKDSVKPMWHGLKEKYLRCINEVNAAQ